MSPSYAGQGSRVEHSRSLLAEMWDTAEYLATDGGDCWMYQDVYELSSPEVAKNFAALLMEDAAFTRDPAAFEPAAVEGLDLAYRSGMEYIAVKGNTAYYITFLEPGSGGDGKPRTDVLAALARLGG